MADKLYNIPSHSKKDDIFDPPTTEELENVFEPPTTEELDIFKAPSQDEIRSVKYKPSKDELFLSDLDKEMEDKYADTQKISKARAFGLGVADIVPQVGGIGAVGGRLVGELSDKLTGKNKELRDKLEEFQKTKGIDLPIEEESWKDTFYGGRDALKKDIEQSYEDRPGFTLGGSLASGAALTPFIGPLTKAASIPKLIKAVDTAKKTRDITTLLKAKEALRNARLLKGVKEGVIYGGASGGLGGEAKLLEGDIEGQLKETLGGAVVGGGIGGLLSVGGMTGRKLLETDIANKAKDAFNRGLRGKDLSKFVFDSEAEAGAREVVNKVNDLTRQIGKEIGGVYENMHNKGVTFNLKNQLEGVKRGLSKLSSPEQDQSKKFIDMIDNLLQESPESLSPIRVHKFVKDELDKYLKVAGRYNITEGGRLASDLKQIVKDQSRDIADRLNLPLKELDNKFYNIKSARQALRMNDRISPIDYEKHKELQRTSKVLTGQLDSSSVKDKDFIAEKLNNVDPTLSNFVSDTIDTLTITKQLTDEAGKQIKSTTAKSLLGSAQAIGESAINIAGQAAKLPVDVAKYSKKSLGDVSRKVLSMTPEKIQNLINTGGSKIKPFTEQLTKALNSSEVSRNAIMFSLYQNPLFRELISDKTE